MAQMIPTEIFSGKEYDTESGAEMALFKIIKNEPNTKDWICFHSLNIQAHECVFVKNLIVMKRQKKLFRLIILALQIITLRIY